MEPWGGLGHEVLIRTVVAAAEMQGQMANMAGVVFVECFGHEAGTGCCRWQKTGQHIYDTYHSIWYDIEEFDKGWFGS